MLFQCDLTQHIHGEKNLSISFNSLHKRAFKTMFDLQCETTLSSLRMAEADAACSVGTPLKKKKERKKRTSGSESARSWWRLTLVIRARLSSSCCPFCCLEVCARWLRKWTSGPARPLLLLFGHLQPRVLNVEKLPTAVNIYFLLYNRLESPFLWPCHISLLASSHFIIDS